MYGCVCVCVCMCATLVEQPAILAASASSRQTPGHDAF